MVDIGERENGVIVCPTGGGKTVIGIELMARRGQRSLVLVHTSELLNQWRERISSGLDMPLEEIGIIGGGKWREGEQFTVAMMQTLAKKGDEVQALEYGLVLVDGCHHSPANTFAQVLDNLPSRHRYGLSATPERRDGLENMIYNRIGAKLVEISKNVVEQAGGIIPGSVKVFRTGFNPMADTWNDYLNEIVNSDDRNQWIGQLAVAAAEKMQTLILTDRIEHAEQLAELTGGLLVHGKLKKAEREEALSLMEKTALTIGTTGLLGEGVDIAGWQTLILATPISNRARLLQAIGRVIRPMEGKVCGYIADLVDDHVFSVSSYRKRAAVYRERNYTILSAL